MKLRTAVVKTLQRLRDRATVVDQRGTREPDST
ncbi:hypothetical protein FOQG_01546 [Fusarium oxysporum f. sp. raphani 54005]|uniref:Uncharacterized protein n=7 Tax=Fusarium oxysporum TaxID=5507 RepID=W9I5U6_FUSOX|nr:hypothetical protein FOYG_09760 [Fusarium oxysporum NRRL 32931]EWZ39824.1 hypothetical protein FOZG_08786 [Fusarium oxysporum Fo47]EWZ88078.1 hypothetical protein FOWG_09674 [Fusarium oxysporum f. sp. lycopersici MN25]EXA40628.1 hypothetical protein FOVG_09391 [Fusarium oxysporum f. sp. pisi HDV247]EXK34482.1 hypothetical protein FOMG_11417 [Fusarium oxysporum f. sp. melonis 26406]EXK98748.1 hypothetical protein FOQG_01546 [Fusarium oxysporum f. sp. raphani 54005]EXL51374.1 hypothetical pr